MNFTDFNSDERSFQTFAGIAEKIRNNKYGRFVIQTYNTEHPIVKAIQDSEFEQFYEKELEQRKNLKYPPFYRIIKLILRTPFQAKMEKETSFIFGRLKILSEENKDLSVFEPFIPQLSKVRDKFRRQIVIKIKGEDIPENLKRTLKNLESDWVIDVDPISLN
jgi:primosomal protein N' (replication factor Y)